MKLQLKIKARSFILKIFKIMIFSIFGFSLYIDFLTWKIQELYYNPKNIITVRRHPSCIKTCRKMHVTFNPQAITIYGLFEKKKIISKTLP